MLKKIKMLRMMREIAMFENRGVKKPSIMKRILSWLTDW